MVTRFLAALVAFSFFFTVSLRAETIVVTTADTGSDPEDGLTSLEEALVQANASLEETVLITFNIPDPNPETPAIDPILIVLNSPLRVQRPMTIDGTTQPGYVPGTPIIQITQSLAGGGEPDEQEPVVAQVFLVKSVSTFIIQFNLAPPPPLPEVAARAVARADGDGAVFRGLSITNSIENGLHFVDGSGHVVEGCFIGIEPDGDAAGNNFAGIFVGVDVEGIRIGTNSDGNNDVLERNVISSNGEDGIYVEGDVERTFNTPGVAAAPVGNILIAGNYLGTGPDGIAARGNGTEIEDGTGIYSEGTSVSVLNNLIASNFIGIWIDEGDAVIQGNVIGLNSDGSAENGNEIGIYVEPNTAVLIGTDSDGDNDTAERNVIAGNFVEINAGNLDEFFPQDTAGLAANLPAAFGEPGELTIAGNYIGTTLDGTAAAVPFDFDDEEGIDQTSGVLALDWPGTLFIRNNVIGGKFLGIEAHSATESEITFQTVIQGNQIGLNAAGDSAIPNFGGIVLVDTDAAIIGTDGDGENDAAERNVISGNLLAGIVIDDEESVNTSPALTNLAAIELPRLKRISGNYIGTNAAGTEAIGNGLFEGEAVRGLAGGILIISTENIIIGTDGDGSAGDAAEGNVISGNAPFGILNLGSSEGNQGPVEGDGPVIAGNIIGLNAAGTAALANGVEFEEAPRGPLITASAILSSNFRTRIGTNNDGVSDALERNVISGNIGNAVTFIEFESAAAQTRAIPEDFLATVSGNLIGTAADGVTPIGNSENGIAIFDTSRILIGGTNATAGNVIANNGANGVLLDGDVFNVVILSNSITNNARLGIDLLAEGDGADGDTPNDEPIMEGEFVFIDSDNGPNSLTNFPVLTTVSLDRKTVTGTLDGNVFSGEGPTNYIVQIFGNPATSPDEGQKLLGSIELSFTTDTVQPAAFTVTLDTPAPPGSFLTATATRAIEFAAETSEFSAPLAVPTLAFASGPSWTPEVPTTDDVVTFTAQPNMPGITVIWDFGDGTPTATGESVTHTFGTPGVYQVTVTLLDEPTGTAITQVITVTVIAGATPPKNTPSFRVRDLNIRLGGSEGKDSITIMGLLNLPKSTTFAGKTIEFDIGGVKESFELNAKGKSKPGAKNFKFGKVNKLRNQETTFNLTLKKATYEAILKSNAVKKDANGLPTELVVRVKFNGQETISIVPLRFRLLKSGATAKFGRF